MIFVEILDRRGRVLRRDRVAGPGFAIGRGYGNEVILDDPFLDAEHARMTWDPMTARFLVEDLGSENGTALAKGPRSQSLSVRPGQVLRLGRTRLRLALSDTPVTAAQSESTGRLRELIYSPRAALGVFVLALLVLTGDSWFTSYSDLTLSTFVAFSFGIAVAFAIWAGCWAIATRLARHQFHFLAHLAVISLVMIPWMVYGWISRVALFLFPSAAVEWTFGWGGQAVIFSVLLAAHLAIASDLGRRARMGVATAVTVGLFALTAVASDYADLFDSLTSSLDPVQAVPVALIPSGTLDEFFNGLEHLKAEVAEELDEPEAEDDLADSEDPVPEEIPRP